MHKLLLSFYFAAWYGAIIHRAVGHQQQLLSGQNEAEYSRPLISLDEHLNLVAKASFKDFLGSPVGDVVEFEIMKAHILYMYEGVHQPSNTVTFLRDNAYIDCIAIMEQPSYYHLKFEGIRHPPPDIQRYQHVQFPKQGSDKGTSVPADAGSFPKMGLPTASTPITSCPDRTIPMRRLTLEELTKFRTLSRFFVKEPQGHDLGVDWDPQKLYAHASQSIDNMGGESVITVWTPTADFSLSQQWFVAGTGCDLQTVEGGWQVYPGKYNTAAPVLFIYYTNHAYNRTGCTTPIQYGCYNLDCPAFVQINDSWILGAGFSQTSVVGSPYIQYSWQWQLYQQAWWLTICSDGGVGCVHVGYYPISVFNGGQLSTGAQVIDFGGEVGRIVGSDWPQMGSGKFADAGWENAALQGQILVVLNDPHVGRIITSPVLTPVPGTQCYTLQGENQEEGYWGTYFYHGGPGAADCSSN
ncbi:Nn.00g105340.m01.CDS01 [Neocucurbitaria sp. VM-36]